MMTDLMVNIKSPNAQVFGPQQVVLLLGAVEPLKHDLTEVDLGSQVMSTLSPAQDLCL